MCPSLEDVCLFKLQSTTALVLACTAVSEHDAGRHYTTMSLTLFLPASVGAVPSWDLDGQHVVAVRRFQKPKLSTQLWASKTVVHERVYDDMCDCLMQAQRYSPQMQGKPTARCTLMAVMCI